MEKTKVNIIWFKRDLRTRDHLPLRRAVANGLPTILLYIYEPSIMSLPQHSIRHWSFIYQCFENLRKDGLEINVLYWESIPIFKKLISTYSVVNIFSHLEVGLKKTYDRDASLRTLFSNNNIPWMEFSSDGIIRGKKDRIGWEENWYEEMEKPLIRTDVGKLKQLRIPNNVVGNNLEKLNSEIKNKNKNFQIGGEDYAFDELDHFMNERGFNYLSNLSYIEKSRIWSSRLSVYLSYGCLSLREVYQAAKLFETDTREGNNYRKFIIRLFWRSHYIQKLETEWNLEFRATNTSLEYDERDVDEELLEAFLLGKTGFPLIDASMRCLRETGFINFRQRAMLVTFATFTLWLDWKKIAVELAALFLDFEPGIHYGQIHLQAGLTGYHTLRIFNPTIQAEKFDRQGIYIKKWLPELNGVPVPYLFQVWNLSEEQQEKFKCKIGEDYPFPIVDYEIATTLAKSYYWKLRNREEVLNLLPDIFNKFCLPKNIGKYTASMEFNLSEIKSNKKKN